GTDASGAAHVADRPEAHPIGERLLVGIALDELRGGVEHAVALEDLTLMREVDRRQLELLARDVLPHVELRPVGDRKDAHLLPLADAAVVEVPQLRALRARVPLPEVVAEREDPLLRARALLVPPCAADRRVEAVLGHRVEERRRLQLVARRARSCLLDHAALVDRLLHRGDHQALAELGDAAVAELDRLGEVVAGVDVHEREREARRGRPAERRDLHADALRRCARPPRRGAGGRGDRRSLPRRRQGRRVRRARRRLGGRVRADRGARGAARGRGRLLARRDHGRLAPAHRPGRPDGHEDRTGDLHRLRHLRRHAAHGGLQGRQADPRDQRGSRGADPAERRLRRDRRPARGRAGDQRGDPRRSVGVSTALSAVALLAALAVATALFARRAHLLYRIVRLGKPTDRSGDLGRRTKAEATVVLGQRKLLQRIVPGLVHAFVFWGFIVLAPTIVMALLGAVDADWTFPWLGHQGWYFLLVDLFCVLVLVGVVSAFGIRKVQRPARFEGSHLREADLILGLIALIVTTLLAWHATQIALGLNEWPAGWSPVSDALSGLFGDGEATEAFERAFVWLHVLTILVFLVYLPYSKHLHIATAGIN